MKKREGTFYVVGFAEVGEMKDTVANTLRHLRAYDKYVFHPVLLRRVSNIYKDNRTNVYFDMTRLQIRGHFDRTRDTWAAVISRAQDQGYTVQPDGGAREA